jgi:uncharacterized protein (DUF58 family)
VRSLYINNRLFYAISIVVLGFVASFILGDWTVVPKALFSLLLLLAIVDAMVLYRYRRGLRGSRNTPERLSNGDENEIVIDLENTYPFAVSIVAFDEIPHQFQRRDLRFEAHMPAGTTRSISYSLRPVKRGEYSFGAVNAFVSSPIGLFARRFRYSQDAIVPVYPSYVQMRKYELLAISNRLTEAGIKRIRRVGQNREFELIKEYVSGDDFRTINWKATARKSHLMVNQYQDERSQQVYCLIDKGRVMQMPFNGLSLLDYAINASLVISNVAIRKGDRAGLVTFQDKIGTTLAASRQQKHMATIVEALYNQKTAYRETDFSALYTHVRRKVNQRSLLLLFTNFESIYGLIRQLPYLKMIGKVHLLVVVFFENTELKTLLTEPATDLKSVYNKAIAEKFSSDKRQIVRELTAHGIQALLTPPELLTVNTINKYLELKSRGLI